MDAIASQITSLTIVYSIVYSDADQRKHQSSASLAFVRRIHRGPVNSPHKWPVTRKMFSFDDVIMFSRSFTTTSLTQKESHILITQGDVKQPWGVWLNGSYGFTANSQYNHKRTKLTKAVYIFYGAFYAAKSVITIQCIMETSRMIPIMGLRVWNGYLELFWWCYNDA